MSKVTFVSTVNSTRFRRSDSYKKEILSLFDYREVGESTCGFWEENRRLLTEEPSPTLLLDEKRIRGDWGEKISV